MSFKKHILYFYPSQLPQSKEQWDTLYHRVTSWYGLPEDDQSRHAISTYIMHLPQHQHRAPLKDFVRVIKKQLANEASYQVIEELRAKAKAAAAVEKEA